jgi:hypothetical protein
MELEPNLGVELDTSAKLALATPKTGLVSIFDASISKSWIGCGSCFFKKLQCAAW